MDHKMNHGSSLKKSSNVSSALLLPVSSSNITAAAGHYHEPATVPQLRSSSAANDVVESNKGALNEKKNAVAGDEASMVSRVKDDEEKTTEVITESPSCDSVAAADITRLQPADSSFTTNETNRTRFSTDEVRPGAVRVPGIIGPQQTHFSDQDEADEGTVVSTAIVSNRVVAEVVDEKQLLHELLSRHQNEVVQAENVVTDVRTIAEYDRTSAEKNEGDDDNYQGTGVAQRKWFTKRKIAAVLLMATVLIAAVVVTAVVISRSKNRKGSPTSTSTPATPPPSSAPQSRQELFRALLLNRSASSQQNLDQPSTPQYQALNWLANFDGAMLDISVPDAETIIDRFVLAVIYYGNGGFKWSSTCDFLSNSSICEWHDTNGNGTFCTTGSNGGGSKKLTELILDGNFLSGVIVTELGMLSSLTLLDLGRNSLHGTIPTQLGKLSSLTELQLGNNQLKGPMPTELGRLSNLKVLNLANNQLTGRIPTELAGLSRVTDLSLGDHNQLTGTIPTELGELSNLSNLNLAYNQLNGTLPTELARLTNLIELQISNTPLTGTIPTELGQLGGLTDMGIWATKFHGTIPTELGELSSLVFLSLDGNNLRGKIPTEFGNLGRLFSSFSELSLCCNSLTGSLPTELAQLSNVQKLRFDQNKLTGTIPTELSALPNLNELYLSRNDFVGTLTPLFCNRPISWLSFWADCSSGNVVCDCCRCF